MRIKAQIPNILTLGNLACGFFAIIVALKGMPGASEVWLIAGLMATAMVLDFFDGFVARLLKVSSPLGGQLDSLADAVTFGILPGVLVFQMISGHVDMMDHWIFEPENRISLTWISYLPLLAVAIPVLSIYRLGKFNLDERDGGVFYGLATPANAFFFLSLFMICVLNNPEYAFNSNVEPTSFITKILVSLTNPIPLTILILVFSGLLVSEFKLIAFKFKSYGFGENWPRYIFLICSLILIAIFFYKAVPLVILLYFAFSIVDNYILKK